MRARRLLALGISAVLLTGCGITNPYARTPVRPGPPATSPTAAAAATTASTTTVNDPSDPPTGRTTPGTLSNSATGATQPPHVAGSATPQAAIARYDRIDTNWTAQTVSATQRHLATLSVGQAKASALQAAASYGSDRVLAASHVSNQGAVVAIATDAARPGTWVVVTSERTTGQGNYSGLPAQLHITYATVTKGAHGYVVSGWAPQT